MISHRHRAALAVVSLSFAAACGIDSALVGGRCRDGMTLENNTCVAPAPEITLITPTEPPDSTAQVAVDSGDAADAADAADAGDADLVSPVKPPDPLQHDPDHDAAVLFPPPPPPPPPPLVCDAPLVACRGACVAFGDDGANCGACGKICPSNICINGECQGATPGDVVLIGHDFTNAWSGSAQAKVLVNALSIPTTDPIRILSYEDGAPADAVAQAKALALAGIHGRGLEVTVASSASPLESQELSRHYDIVLIHDASAGDAFAIGGGWSSSLGLFTMKGGVVVALDRGATPVPTLLSSAGLLAVTSHMQLVDGAHLAVTAAGDVVGAQVLSPYAGFGPSVTFQGVGPQTADLSYVVRAKGAGDTLGDPVVVHRIVR